MKNHAGSKSCDEPNVIFKTAESFQFYSYFQLACFFQKRYTCPKKILNTKMLFKKMSSKVPLFSAKVDFKAQIWNEIFKISYPNFNHVIYTGGQRLKPAFVNDIKKKSTFKNRRDEDRSDFK